MSNVLIAHIVGVVGIAVIAPLSGCTGGGADQRRAAPPSTAAAAAGAPFRVERLADIDAGPGFVNSVVVFGDYVTWVGASTPTTGIEGETDQVLVYNLATGATEGRRIIARTAFPNGAIRRVRAHRDTIVYVDQDRVTTDAEPTTGWRIHVVSVADGANRVIAESTNAADREDTPRPSIAWPWVVWLHATGDADGHLSVRSFNLSDGKQRVLAPKTLASQLAMDDTTATAYYDDDSGEDTRDIFAVPADGSAPPRQVTTSGRADFPIARNGGLVWQEPPWEDSESLWYLPLGKPGAKPRKFATSSDGLPAGSNAIPGRRIILWHKFDRLAIADASGRRPDFLFDTSPSVEISARWWVEGDRVVWATAEGFGEDSQTTIHVADVH